MGSSACLDFWAEAAYSARAEGCWLRASPFLICPRGDGMGAHPPPLLRRRLLPILRGGGEDEH